MFRDELLRLFPDDPLARKLSQQTFLLLSEFLEQHRRRSRRALTGQAVVHPHCHHRASFKPDDEMAVLKRTGLDVTVLDSGCCGMAGAFGFEREHYDVSLHGGGAGAAARRARGRPRTPPS